MDKEDVARAAASIRTALGADFPRTAIMLGSGLDACLDALSDIRTLPFSEIPGFPVPSVPGHAGVLMTGRMAGVPVAVLRGRVHAYEDLLKRAYCLPVRTLKALGVGTLILTSAVGGIAEAATPGALVLISDHINFSGFNPLSGAGVPAGMTRFVDMSAAYDPVLRQMFWDVARAENIPLTSGIYLFTRGPNFETPAEVRMFRALGADVVGMSMVPECLVARQAGMNVAGLAVVTNRAAGLADSPLSHEGTLAAAQNAGATLRRLLEQSADRFSADV